MLAGELNKEIAPIHLPAIVKRIDVEVRRRGNLNEDTQQRVRAIIREVSAAQSVLNDGQLQLPGVVGE